MEAENIIEHWRRRPFQPFHIHVTDGQSYEVRHPEQMWITRRWSYIGLGDNGDLPYERDVTVANVHITRITSLEG